MSQARRIETTLAASSLVAGFVANFTGLMLIGRMPLIAALVALGTTGLVGAMLLVAAGDRNNGTQTLAPN